MFCVHSLSGMVSHSKTEEIEGSLDIQYDVFIVDLTVGPGDCGLGKLTVSRISWNVHWMELGDDCATWSSTWSHEARCGATMLCKIVVILKLK